jgi:hypothetical protein
VCTGGTWNATSAINDPVRAFGQEGNETVRPGHAWVFGSVAQTKGLLAGALDDQNAIFQASINIAPKLIDTVAELISVDIRSEHCKINPHDLAAEVALTGLRFKIGYRVVCGDRGIVHSRDRDGSCGHR